MKVERLFLQLADVLPVTLRTVCLSSQSSRRLLAPPRPDFAAVSGDLHHLITTSAVALSGKPSGRPAGGRSDLYFSQCVIWHVLSNLGQQEVQQEVQRGGYLASTDPEPSGEGRCSEVSRLRSSADHSSSPSPPTTTALIGLRFPLQD